jgi:alpha/beta superfamily hydrolase
MASQEISFASENIICEGVFDRPEQMIQAPAVALCHPHPLHGGDMANTVIKALAEAFTGVGFAVLRFNFRGVGKSTGHYAQGIGEQEDAKAALTWLSAQAGIDVSRLFLAGYSFGARVTLAVASTDPRVHGFLVVAPPTRHGDWPSLTSCRGPKIFICGDCDPHTIPEALANVVKRLDEPKRLVIFQDADHFFVGHERTLTHQAARLLKELL